MATATAPQAPPYVSLLDRLEGLAGTLLHGGNESSMIPHGKIAPLLTALIHYVEHGSGLLDASDAGYADVEGVLTPERPEGWVPPSHLIDPRDAEIARLKAQLAEGAKRQPDAKDVELERLRAEAAAQTSADDADRQAFTDWRAQQERDATAAGLATSTTLPPGAADMHVSVESENPTPPVTDDRTPTAMDDPNAPKDGDPA